ncbi:formate dehydrogenase accessory sulfurtransferase FdhD [Chloroflexota bacterium]
MTVKNISVAGITPDIPCRLFSGESWLEETATLPSEMSLTIFINNVEAVTILCTPAKLNCLVIGFLYSEGVINSVRDIASMRICDEEPIADVQLLDKDYTVPAHRTLTSGCGGGMSFAPGGQRVESKLSVAPREILTLMRHLHQQQNLFRQSGGLHASALCDRKQILIANEDIGRHNTLDKILGECLLREIPTADRILLTTGRVSSEMMAKAAKMQVPVVVSRSAPTERAVALGREMNITLVGYARENRLSVFTGIERLDTTA